MAENSVYCFKNETYASALFANLNALRKNGVLYDVILVSSDRVEFPVHRVVLSAGCTYFDVLLNINMVEQKQTHVHLKTVPSSSLSKVLEYLYTGVLRVTKDSVTDLIFTSSMFLLFNLTEYCWHVFVETLDMKNCISRKILADNISSVEVGKSVTSFILKNFVNLDSQSLAECPLQILRDVLSCEKLCANNELEVLGVLLRWLLVRGFDHVNASLDRIVGELLSLVRFKFICLTKEELMVFLQSCNLSKNSWLWNEVFGRCENKLHNRHDEERLSYKKVDVVMVVGGHGESSVLKEVCGYVPSTEQWFQVAPMHHARRSFGLVSIDNALYAVGGTMEKSHYTPMPLIECYNLHKNTWEEIHVPISSELERDNAAVIGLRDRIVVSGGFVFTSCSVSASVVELNPASGQWRELASLHTARESHATVVNDVTMYVIGGRNLSGCLSSVERYDKDTETWKVVASMNNSRAHACALWYKSSIYVFGGFDGDNVLNSVEVYNPNTKSWRLLPVGMSTPRMKFALSLCCDDAFVIGGMTGSRGPMTCEIERYNLLTSTSHITSMSEKKMEMSCAKLSLADKVITRLAQQ